MILMILVTQSYIGHTCFNTSSLICFALKGAPPAPLQNYGLRLWCPRMWYHRGLVSECSTRILDILFLTSFCWLMRCLQRSLSVSVWGGRFLELGVGRFFSFFFQRGKWNCNVIRQNILRVLSLMCHFASSSIAMSIRHSWFFNNEVRWDWDRSGLRLHLLKPAQRDLEQLQWWQPNGIHKPWPRYSVVLRLYWWPSSKVALSDL